MTIYRTSIAGRACASRLQVVARRVTLPVEELTLDPRGGDALAQLVAADVPRMEPAPCAAAACAHSPPNPTATAG